MSPVDHLKQLPAIRAVTDWVTNIESEWFDYSRHVRTAKPTFLKGFTLQGEAVEGSMYIAARPAPVRAAMRELPIRDYHDYTFIDFGSGQGRILFLAAEYPFKKIQGLEIALELHRDAERNIESY